MHAASSTVTPPPHGSRFASHFVESVLLTWLSSFVRIVIGFVALRLVTGAIAEDALGAYWVLTSVSSLLSNFADLGIGLGAVRHLPIAPDAAYARRLMHTLVLLRVAVLAVLCAAIFVFRPWILRLFDAQVIADKYVYLYPFVIITSLAELYTNYLQGLNRFRLIALFALVSSAARLILIALFVRTFGMGVDGLFLSEVLSMALGVAASALATGQGWKLAFDRQQGREQIRFGFPLYLNTLMAYTANRINTVMIGSMSGTAAVSFFTVASRVPDQLLTVVRSYVYVYLPNMSRLLAGEDRHVAERLLATSLRLMSFCFGMLTVGLCFFRHEILHLLAPASYQIAAPAVTLLAGGMAFSALGFILGITLVATGDSRTPFKINVWTSLLSFGLNLYFIRRWGFIGAAWANLVFNIVAYAITDVVLSRRMRPEGRSYIGILLILGVALGLGMRAGLAVRLAVLVGAGLGSLLLSRQLRNDLWWVWNARRRRRAPSTGTLAADARESNRDVP
jgi:O-antigen/teichoic acid export membrane protein